MNLQILPNPQVLNYSKSYQGIQIICKPFGISAEICQEPTNAMQTTDNRQIQNEGGNNNPTEYKSAFQLLFQSWGSDYCRKICSKYIFPNIFVVCDKLKLCFMFSS